MSNLQTQRTEDELLIERFLNGDEAGFETLVKKYQNRVINIIYSLTNVGQDSDDIAHEAFVKVYKNLHSFQKKAAFSTWLYRITVHTTYNYLKKAKRHISLTNDSEIEVIKKGSLENLESKQRQELIRKALEKLPFKFRSVLVLKEIEELSYKDIAKTLGCRIGTVESRLFRARKMLKTILSSNYKEV